VRASVAAASVPLAPGPPRPAVSLAPMERIHVIDSHTEGEPTRLVVGGGPDLGHGPMEERLRRLRSEHDDLRTAVVREPRGSDVLVGALLCEPLDPTAAAGVVFFNDVGYLGMCGHGTIGVIATLAHLGRLAPGRHRLETPVGEVAAELHADGRVSVHNVPAYRSRAGVVVDLPGGGRVQGDVAWGGNWFFLVGDHGVSVEPAAIPELTAFAWRVRRGLAAAGITGDGGAEIDHVELLAPSPSADARAFVLCPGGAYDRSPCGTGTSAKLACLAADGRLAPGRTWVQESVIGGRFEASYRLLPGGRVAPTITGRAWVTAEAWLIRDPGDPFRDGIPAAT
jgi:4-hydroxyproline epimerase